MTSNKDDFLSQIIDSQVVDASKEIYLMQFGVWDSTPLTASDGVCVIDINKFLAENLNIVGPMSSTIEVIENDSGVIAVNFKDNSGNPLGI